MAEADRLRLAGRVPADYVGYGYAPLLADDMVAVAGVADDVANASASAAASAVDAADSAAEAGTQATNAQASRLAAEGAVAQVTVGSTASLAYPEQVRNLITATDVVDVFVYDTRLDSDGGAWTERCAGTSWFQETLNTATRGAKRAFPKLALIVAQQTKITIYDALDLDPATSVPRMWMVFNGGSDNVMLRVVNTANAITEVKALNGKLYRGGIHAARAFVMIDFAEDSALHATAVGGVGVKFGIVNRNNSALLWNAVATSSYPNFNSVFALDVRVLPNAPVSGVTGLPIATVVAATTPGFSVAHPLSEQVARGALVTLTGGYNRVRFTPDNRIVAIGTTAPGIADVGPIPYAATTANTAWRTHRIGSSAITATGGIILPDAALTGSTLVDLAEGAVAQGSRLALLAEDTGDLASSLVASVGPSFTSGWMPQGRTVFAALGQGVTGNAVGISNPIVNGDFATGDLTGWTNGTTGTGSATVAAGVLTLFRATTSDWGRISQSVTTIVGETYRVSWDTLNAQNLTVAAGTGAFGAQVLTYTAAVQRLVQSATFVATSTTTWISFLAGSNGQSPQVDNISVALVAGDANGTAPASPLDVVGTLSRTAVGTGNDLAGWSGFSASNYLTQPYNAGLDFGTGDFSAAFWFNNTGAGHFFDRWSGTGQRIRAFVNSNKLGFQIVNSASALVSSTSDVINGGWNFAVLTRRGTIIEVWLNGAREATLDASSVGTLTNTSAVLRLGVAQDGTTPLDFGSLALFRMASYAPTPGQITRMFRDEQRLFQTGAKAFLGMASTATVKRLSRSRFNGRLAVAMSDGLALFDGLVRVERHTSGTLSPAMASSDVPAISMEAGSMLIGTASNIGVRRDAVIGMDRLEANPTTPGALRVFRARGVTVDATPLILAPRLQIGERETVVVSAMIVGRVYGASDTQRLTYERRATYYRDAGGNVTLAGSVQVVGTDVEVTSTADATLVIDTTAQTVAAQVTGIAATRLVWAARFQIERTTHEASYEEVV